MRRRIRTAALSGLALAALVGLGLPALAGASHAPAGTSKLTAIRTATHPGYDRLVFEFSGKLPSRTFVQWAPKVTRDGSGATVPAAGNAFLQIGLSGVTGYTASHAPSFGPLRRSTGNENLNQVVHAGEFEGMVSFGAATMARTSYSVTKLTNPSRVVIDIGNTYARSRVPVYLTNKATAETRSVWRYVPSASPGHGRAAPDVRRPDPGGNGRRRQQHPFRRDRVHEPVHRRLHRPGAADRWLRVRRVGVHDREPDRRDALALFERPVGEDPRAVRPDRQPDREHGLAPGLPRTLIHRPRRPGLSTSQAGPSRGTA